MIVPSRKRSKATTSGIDGNEVLSGRKTWEWIEVGKECCGEATIGWEKVVCISKCAGVGDDKKCCGEVTTCWDKGVWISERISAWEDGSDTGCENELEDETWDLKSKYWLKHYE